MRHVVSIHDSVSSGCVYKMCPNGRNEAPMAESFKSPPFDIEERDKQVGDNLVAFQVPRGRPINKGYLTMPPSWNNFNEGIQPMLGVDSEGQPLQERRYLTRVRRVFEEWWKNHILHKHVVEMRNETYLGEYLKLCATMSFGNIIYKNDRQQSLSRARKLKFFDWS